METTTKTLARINGVNILLVENGERLIPIKPLCEALGINSNGQIERIKTDPILGSVNKMCLSTGSDKKQYQMFAIPFRYVFGWLFTIDSEKVNLNARETVLRYQKECYDVLYNHFTAHAEFYEYKQSLVYEKNTQLRIIKAEFNTAKTRLEDARKEFEEIMDMRFEEWQAKKQQLQIVFENGNEVKLGNADEVKALDE